MTGEITKTIQHKEITLTTSPSGNLFARDIPELNNDGSNYINGFENDDNSYVIVPWIWQNELLLKIKNINGAFITNTSVTITIFYY